MLGRPQFTDEDLVLACADHCAEFAEDARLHIGRSGWYSIEVLCRLFDMTDPPLGQAVLAPYSTADYNRLLSGDELLGCFINQNNDHWVAITKHLDSLWYLDSKYMPVSIDEHNFADIVRLYPRGFLVERHDGA